MKLNVYLWQTINERKVRLNIYNYLTVLLKKKLLLLLLIINNID